MRTLTTSTRIKVEGLISRLAKGQTLTLDERIKLNKYGLYIPFVADMVNEAIKRRESYQELDYF